MIKNIILFITSVLIFTACSKSKQLPIDEVGKEVIDGKESGDYKFLNFKLSTTEGVENIFSPANFQISAKIGISLFDIETRFDSIDWHVEGLEGKLPIFRTRPGHTNLITEWSHHFYLPSDYKSFVLGYKGGKVIYSDTVDTKIIDKKDFLSFNWKDISTNSNVGKGYTNALSDESTLITLHGIDNGLPFVWLYYSNPASSEKEELENVQRSKRLLHDHMTELYGEPKWKTNDPELSDKFNSLFKNRQEDYSVSAIWITPTSKLALIERASWKNFLILSEPL